MVKKTRPNIYIYIYRQLLLLVALLTLLTVNVFAGSDDEVVGNQYSIAVSMPVDCYAYADNTIVTSGIPISPTSLVTGENGLEMYISKVSVIPKNGWTITAGPDYGAKEFGITIGGKQVTRDATGSYSVMFGKAASPIVKGEIPAEIKLNYSANTGEGDASDVADVIVYMMADSEVLTVPTQSGSLIYTGSTLAPSWTGYDATKMTMSGTTSATGAGTYTATFEPKFGYCWSDGSMDPRNVTWSIGKTAGSLTLSASSATIDYNATTTAFTVTKTGDGAITATSSNTSVATVAVSGSTVTVTKKAAGTATITVSVAAGTNHTAPANKTCAITCIGSLTVPAQSGTLTYTGSAQSPSWSNYDATKMDISGTTSSTNAGSFTAAFTPKTNYKWSDGTSAAKSVTWTIGKAVGSLSLSKSSATIDYNATTTTFTVTRPGDGAITATSSNTSVATVAVSGTTVTVTKKAAGTATITVSVAAGTNHTAPANKTCAITCIGSLTVPSQRGTLTYTGSYQSPSWSNYSSATSTIGGTTSGANAGSYTATFTPKTNYKWSDGTSAAKSVTWTIGKAAGSVTAPTAKSLYYTGNAQALVNAGSSSTGTIQYKLNNGSYSTSIPTATNAGTYTVYYKVVGDSNHNDVGEKSISVTIDRRISLSTYTKPSTVTSSDMVYSYAVSSDRTSITMYLTSRKSTWDSTLNRDAFILSINTIRAGDRVTFITTNTYPPATTEQGVVTQGSDTIKTWSEYGTNVSYSFTANSDGALNLHLTDGRKYTPDLSPISFTLSNLTINGELIYF